MITVNPIYINYVLDPLIGGGDSEEPIELYGFYNTNIEKDVKNLASLVLFPEFQLQKPILQISIKNSFAFYLAHPDKVNFEEIFNSLLLPIETPKDSKIFFRWIWDTFFNNELPDYIKNEIIEEDFDVNAPYYLLTNKNWRIQ